MLKNWPGATERLMHLPASMNGATTARARLTTCQEGSTDCGTFLEEPSGVLGLESPTGANHARPTERASKITATGRRSDPRQDPRSNQIRARSGQKKRRRRRRAKGVGP